MNVTAVIPVHNRAELLERLLRTMQMQLVPFDRIIVVDNASTDRAVPVALAFGCEVIRMGENAGFARAVNAGVREASTEWVAILNSDIELTPGWLGALLHGAADAGFATGLLLSALDSTVIDGTYDLVSRAGCAWRAGHGAKKSAQTFAPGNIGIAPGTACIFRRNVFLHLNGYDESFGSYLEDVDLGLRCVQAGIRGVFVPAAVAMHHGSATLGRWNPQVVRLLSRNQLRLIAKHYDRAFFRSCFLAILTGQLLWGIVAARHGALLAWFAGKREGLREFRLTGNPSPRLRAFLAGSEHEIRQRATDSYWRWYFRLNSPLRPPPRTGQSAAH